MNISDIHGLLFRQAVAAVDSGDLAALRALLDEHPRLVQDRLDIPEEGYFQHPYLLWFVADNPIRNHVLPGNIVEVTRTLIDYVRKYAPDTASIQLNYTLGLVDTGRIPRECGVQIEMIDLLIDAGAKPGSVMGAIAHGNHEAAAHVIRRGGELTFSTAVGLGWKEDIQRLAGSALQEEWNLALIVAAFLGNAEMIGFLLRGDAAVNEIPEKCHGFHSHATALHQAVASGSLKSVKLLVEAGADLNVADRVYQGTPLGWAMYMPTEEGMVEEMKEKYREIESYLRSRV